MNVFQEGWINFKNLWTSKGYVGFKGRATRREFWTTQIYLFIFSVAACLLDLIFSLIVGASAKTDVSFSFFSTVWGIVIFLPSLALLMRRVHDVGYSSWWVLSSLIVDVFTSIVTVLSVAFGVFYLFMNYGFKPYMFMHTDASLALLILLCVMSILASVTLSIIIFVFTLLKGQPGANKYGDERVCTLKDDTCCCKKSNGNSENKAEDVVWQEVKTDDIQEERSEDNQNTESSGNSDNLNTSL